LAVPSISVVDNAMPDTAIFGFCTTLETTPPNALDMPRVPDHKRGNLKDQSYPFSISCFSRMMPALVNAYRLFK
jgi:hypothetical protein